MLLQYNQTVSYICPNCSGISVDTIQIFNFSGNRKRVLTCAECCEKCVTIEPKRDKYKITVECPVCDVPHVFTTSFSKFWYSDFISYKCPDSDLEIYFQGTVDHISYAIENQAKILSDMFQRENSFGNNLLINEMIRYIQFLASSDAIMCRCGALDIQIDISDECITLICPHCGAEKVFYSDEKSLALLLSSNIIILDNDNE